MKPRIFFLLCVAAMLSCTKLEISPTMEKISKGLSEDGSVFSNEVSLVDIENVINGSNMTKSCKEIVKYAIEPYHDKDGEVLMYIVNFDDGGWKIYSADKRTPPIIAEGEKGRFSLKEGSPALSAWLQRSACTMSRIKKAEDSQLRFGEEKIAQNVAFWTGEPPVARAPGLPINPGEPVIPRGHWEETVTTETEFVSTCDHLVAKWDQTGHYAQCCPLLHNSSTTHAPVGCVAVAGAQVLYYLNQTIGVPVTMYSTCECTGDVHGFTKVFGEENSTTWSRMESRYNRGQYNNYPEAVLLSWVGERVGMHYWDTWFFGDFSWAFPSNLKTELFDYYNINCNIGDYDASIVRSSLLNNVPVIVTSADTMIPNGRIHCFVIDGYRLMRTKYIHTFEWVYEDNTTEDQINLVAPYTTITYSEPYISDILINWGWASQWGPDRDNDGFYSLTDDWEVTTDDTYTYNHTWNMIYGFPIID